MNRRLVMVLVFAAIVGLVASFFVDQVMRQLALAGAPEATEPVVVAAVNMSMAETVTGQHVRLVQWPKGRFPLERSGLANAEGRVVRSATMAGEPLLESRLAPELAGAAASCRCCSRRAARCLDKGGRGDSREGSILPNSRVDVLVSMSRPGSTQQRIAR